MSKETEAKITLIDKKVLELSRITEQERIDFYLDNVASLATFLRRAMKEEMNLEIHFSVKHGVLVESSWSLAESDEDVS